VTASVDELLARATSRVDARNNDAKSGSKLERVVIDGDRYFVKQLSPATDWIMRIGGDLVHWSHIIWQAGIMDRVPDCIDHTIVAMEVQPGDDPVMTIIMRDVGEYLVPEGNTEVSAEQHGGFIDHMAALHATFWDFHDHGLHLARTRDRLRFFSSDNIARELGGDDVPGPIAAADAGWRELETRSPLLSRLAAAVHIRPELVTEPLAFTPVTFLHGDWKMGNLGTHPDGRTILVDWTIPGSGPPCYELGWYLALNRARLPEPKEAVLERYRTCLEQRGITTAAWWDKQVDLCLIAIMATFGWEKGLDDEAELRWWERTVAEAMERQQIILK
jgi:aminoglycoside phosphotransferase (APT) family kinase protein